MYSLLDRMRTRRLQALHMDVEERRHEREAAPRNWGSADAGRGHVPLASPAPLVGDHDVNDYTPRG